MAPGGKNSKISKIFKNSQNFPNAAERSSGDASMVPRTLDMMGVPGSLPARRVAVAELSADFAIFALRRWGGLGAPVRSFVRGVPLRAWQAGTLAVCYFLTLWHF